MKKDDMIERYSDGERQCPMCGESLPAHNTWPGSRYRFCGMPACAQKVRQLSWGRYVDADTEKCQAEGCTNFAPEGRYKGNYKYFACSPDCYQRRASKGSHLMTCGCGCGETFFRDSLPTSKSGLVFLSSKHMADYVKEKYLKETCGPFRSIAEEYFNGVASLHYSELRGVRHSISLLFLFLTESAIVALEDVSPQTITQFILWMKNTGRTLTGPHLSYISTFFSWMIAEGRRKAANPVTRWHRRPKSNPKPRPLKEHELSMMWNLLIERGNPKVRLAAAFGLEAGLRIGEMCRVQISDVDLDRQQLIVRLPNKARREEPAFFGAQTVRYWHEWMTERDSASDHDNVLYNENGKPYTPYSLRRAFQRVLCKEYEGKRVSETGFDSWSTHRLRHTMATKLAAGGADLATVMVAGRWRDPETMAGYVEVADEQARRGYDDAMRRSEEQRLKPAVTRSVSPEQLLELWAAEEAEETVPAHELEDCV